MAQHIGASKYTPDQREAVVYALVDGGMTIRECIARAQAGQLVTRAGRSAGSFRIPSATAALWARTEREQRELSRNGPLHRQPPAQAIDEIRSRLLRIVDKQLTRAELQPRPDRQELRELTQLTAQIRRLLPEAPKMVPNSPGSKPSETPFTDRLARELAKETA